MHREDQLLDDLTTKEPLGSSRQWNRNSWCSRRVQCHGKQPKKFLQLHECQWRCNLPLHRPNRKRWRRQYALHLLEVASELAQVGKRYQPSRHYSVAMARKPMVEVRLDAILNDSRRLSRRLGRSGAAALLLLNSMRLPTRMEDSTLKRLGQIFLRAMKVCMHGNRRGWP